jgi:predicted TIM-barrel fold metal-dependent hydrolase
MKTREIKLREFQPRSMLVLEDHIPQKARFPTIDCNDHFGRGQDWKTEIQMPYPKEEWAIPDLTAGIALMDELNIRFSVNLDGGWGDTLQRNLERYKEPYPDRFAVFTWVDWQEIDIPNFEDKWTKELERSVKAGAQGLAVFKTLGLEFRDRKGSFILPDDPRLESIWSKAGELNIPVLIHTADPIAFFKDLDETNERWEELSENPDWHYFGKDFPSFNRLIDALLCIVERHPDTTFIAAHVMGCSENLPFVAQNLDKYANLYVDIAERISELGRQPYTSRKFLTKYADRVFFGTDTFVPDRKKYQTYFRILETDDEYFDYGTNQGRWKAYGLNLEDSALRKIYYENAARLFHLDDLMKEEEVK